jgi:hypothetical protein
MRCFKYSYEGISFNFWALYDNNPAYVGATIHMLSKGLDSGDMIFHCVPKLFDGDTAFDFTMRSVAALSAATYAANGDLLRRPRVPQTKEMEVRYTRKAYFTDEVALEFLNKNYVIKPNELNYPKLLSSMFF